MLQWEAGACLSQELDQGLAQSQRVDQGLAQSQSVDHGMAQPFSRGGLANAAALLPGASAMVAMLVLTAHGERSPEKPPTNGQTVAARHAETNRFHN